MPEDTDKTIQDKMREILAKKKAPSGNPNAKVKQDKGKVGKNVARNITSANNRYT